MGTNLFQWGRLVGASGIVLDWKVECDALEGRDWRCLALIVRDRLPPVREVEGIPRGGLAFADALRRLLEDSFDPNGVRLLVDDVWTTGSSVAKVREDGDLVVVAFARGSVPDDVLAVWNLGEWARDGG